MEKKMKLKGQNFITSETSHVRPLLAKWCQGYGLDVGFGGDKIVPHAISVDLPTPYHNFDLDPLQLGGDARNLFWFNDSVLDFVYSSHLLEDFEEIVEAINEFARVLKLDGYLILYLPDEQLYKAYCNEVGDDWNQAHKHSHFNADYVKACVEKSLYNLELIFESGIVNYYSFALVFKKKT